MANKALCYHMEPEGKGIRACACFMGLAFFLRVVYYFGFTRTESVGFGVLLLMLVVPMVLEAAFMILLRGVKLDAPGLYGILVAAYCVLLIMQGLQYGNLLRMIFAIVAYLVCGGIFLAVTAGLLSREIAVTLFFVTACVRFLFVLGPYILSMRLIAFLPEAAGLSAVVALGCLACGLKPVDGRKR